MQVGNTRVALAAGLLMAVAGVFGKLGALFVIIPNPVIGGVLMIMFGESRSCESCSSFNYNKARMENAIYIQMNSNTLSRTLFLSILFYVRKVKFKYAITYFVIIIIISIINE